LTADIQKICEIARQQQEQLADVQRQLAAEQAQTAKMMASEQAQRAQLLAASKRAAKNTLHELQTKLKTVTAAASLNGEEPSEPEESRPVPESMEVDRSVVTDSLRHIKELEEKLKKSQSALKRFVDPQKANMNGTGPTNAAKRQKLNPPHFAADRSDQSTYKIIGDHGVVTASRLGYEEENGHICALRDESIQSVKEGKMHLREFNHRMAQLHSSMGLQDADGGLVRASSERYRADGTPDGPMGLEFGYNMRDQNPGMCSRLQNMINERSARDLMKGSETTVRCAHMGTQARIY